MTISNAERQRLLADLDETTQRVIDALAAIESQKLAIAGTHARAPDTVTAVKILNQLRKSLSDLDAQRSAILKQLSEQAA